MQSISKKIEQFKAGRNRNFGGDGGGCLKTAPEKCSLLKSYYCQEAQTGCHMSVTQGKQLECPSWACDNSHGSFWLVFVLVPQHPPTQHSRIIAREGLGEGTKTWLKHALSFDISRLLDVWEAPSSRSKLFRYCCNKISQNPKHFQTWNIHPFDSTRKRV